MFQEHLDRRRSRRADRNRRSGAVLYLDLDDFKLVNDNFGHTIGDDLLQEVAGGWAESPATATWSPARAATSSSSIWRPRRPRAEPGANAEAAARSRARCDALHEPFLSADTELPRGHIGVSVFPDDATRAEAMLKHGDIAIYAEGGRAATATSSSLRGTATPSPSSRWPAACATPPAATSSSFTTSRCEPHDGHVVGVEALIRWNDPARGMLAPMEFLPLAERTGLIRAAIDWVIDEACRQSADWRTPGPISSSPSTCRRRCGSRRRCATS